ncbi:MULTISPECIES: acetate/propionate family kinase [unclassified Inquilinus]|uniref:acetate/propionate family kinase n=1 Tax=unclassified Inquilinus TaxID=2645927 RepID=UPI003F90F265
MIDAVLVLNAGSSSLKFALYERDGLALLCRGGISEIGRAGTVKASGPRAAGLTAGGAPPAGADRDAVTRWLVSAIRRLDGVTLAAAGHRVVHGGARFRAPVRIDPTVMAALETLIPLAPNHQQHNLAAIAAVEAAWPGLPQVACFDTAFHRTLPRLAQLFPLPRELTEQGIIRYGFHGLSYEYIAGLLPDLLGTRASGRVIVAHLGSGASLCAMANRASIATTMGFTALDGLMMGTRCGAIDPGIVLYLLNQRTMSPAAVDELLNTRSGLLGVSGVSSDAHVLEESTDPHAAEALELFAYRVVREAGSLVAALGGLDAFVFTAGIGEHSARLRRMICQGMAWAGLQLDTGRNDRAEGRISRDGSPVDILVVPTDEELPIARSLERLIGGNASHQGDTG